MWDCLTARRAKAVIGAMQSIEADYESLRGVLPKSEYQELDNAVLGQLLRTLNPDELKQVSGDVFGRIYEYFLTRFGDQKAHHGGENISADRTRLARATVAPYPSSTRGLELHVFLCQCFDTISSVC